MNDAQGLLVSFKEILPKVLDWIEDYILAHNATAKPVLSFGFKRLGDYFSDDLLARSRFDDGKAIADLEILVRGRTQSIVQAAAQTLNG
jgi:hypothetical protein